MTGFLPTAIGSICRLVNGRAFKPTDWSTEGIPIVRIQNLNDSDKPFNYYKGRPDDKHLVDHGDVLLSWSGTPGTSFGCFIWNRGKGVLNQHIFKVHVDESKVDKEYFVFAVNSVLDEMIAQAHGGVGLRHITKGKLEALKLPLHRDIQEQQRIVCRIKAMMERVQEIRNLHADVTATKPLISRSLLREHYDSLCKTTTCRPLHQLAEAIGGGTPSKKRPDYWQGAIPWVSPKDMKVAELFDATDHISQEGVDNSSTRLIAPPAVLFVVRGMILAHTLPVAVSRVPLTINQDMKALIPGKAVSADYLAYMLRGASGYLLNDVEIAGHGTRRLKTAVWSNLPIPVLRPDQEAEFVEMIKGSERVIADLQEEVIGKREVTALTQAILRKAFAGEL